MSGYAQTFEFSFATAARLPLELEQGCAIQPEPTLNGSLMWSSQKNQMSRQSRVVVRFEIPLWAMCNH
jgi:hypothetical protein